MRKVRGIRSDDSSSRFKYSLAKIVVINVHFSISACLNRDFVCVCVCVCVCVFVGGWGGGVGD